MTALIKIVCGKCGWTNRTRYHLLAGRKCPECGAAALKEAK